MGSLLEPPPGFFTAANKVVRPLLRSPLHWPLSHWVLLLTYTGARSGREYTVPVGYYLTDPGEAWVFSARTGWMSSLRDGRPVRLTIRGRAFEATPTVVEDREAVAGLVQDLVARKGPLSDPMLGLPRDREPTREEALEAADRARIARLRVWR